MTALSGNTQPCWTVTWNCSRSLSVSSFHHLTIFKIPWKAEDAHTHRTIISVHVHRSSHTYTDMPHITCPLAKHALRALSSLLTFSPHSYVVIASLSDFTQMMCLHSWATQSRDVCWRKETKWSNRRRHVIFLSCDSWQLRSRAWVMSC